ncbi:ABC transporter ATP-binding protein, partial [Gemmatimonas sp.]
MTTSSAVAPRLAARALTKTYGAVTALDHLDLEIGAGDVYCLLGANGAGKTTTINLFLNFVAPTSGQALVCGIDVTRDPLGSKRHLAYIPETVMLYRQLTALENLDYFAGLATGEQFSRDQLVQFLVDAGLRADQATQRVGGFSKGMRQKVGIAIAIAKRADVLLLDEPT